MTPHPTPCPPSLELEELAVGDAAPRAESHVLGCDGCAAKVESMRAEISAFAKARPTDRFLTQLEARKQRAPSRAAPALGLAIGLAATALAVVLIVSAPVASEPPIGFKGTLGSITAKRGDTILTLGEGDAVRPGDTLRFTVRAPASGHAVVLERDGAGEVAVAAPFGATVQQPVEAGTTTLEGAAVVDEAPGPETFVTIFSPKPVALSGLVEQLRAGKAVECEGCRVEQLTLQKRP